MAGRRARRRLGAAAAAAGAVVVAIALAGLLTGRDDSGETGGISPGTLRKPIDPRQQTAMPFETRSHWLQPWRAYLDTPPATRLSDAIGINFNVEPAEAEATARLLSRSGFKRARVEFGWDAISAADPSELKDPARVRAVLGALRKYRIRPLILLNANHGAPGPTQPLTVRLTRAAAKGSRRVQLDPGTTGQVRRGRSGLNRSDGKAADVIFTSVDAKGVATLSKPLPQALAAGDHKGATLFYAPFGPPRLTDGRPNPAFERTLRGWLEYCTTIVRQSRRVIGSDSFDVEIWNEQTFGADFLFQDRYYAPPRETGQGDVTEAILDRTVQTLRRLSPTIGIGDGFASQTPFPSGATSPRGLTAIDKHPYYGIKRFPKDDSENESTPLDARGRPTGFTPRYDALFPEYILTGIQTENMIRDLSPITTMVNGVPHGRKTRPRGGKAPETWITEANIDPTGADPSDPTQPGKGPIDRLRPADVRHLHAKAALRYYTAFVNKGVSAVDLFAVKGGYLSLVNPDFFERLSDSPGTYPGDAAGGEMPRAVRRLTDALRGAEPIRTPQPLTLEQVSGDEGRVQFEGDGKRGRPPLYDRDVLTFFPFQLASGRWVAAVYVMTRNLAKPYGDGSDPKRYDLPEARFRITVGGLDGRRLGARASDPLSGSDVDVDVISRERRAATIELPATDSPRLVFLTER